MFPFPQLPQPVVLPPKVRAWAYLVLAVAGILVVALVPWLGEHNTLLACVKVALPLLSSLFFGVAASNVRQPDPADTPATPLNPSQQAVAAQLPETAADLPAAATTPSAAATAPSDPQALS